MIGTLSMLRFFAWNPLDHACLVSGWKRWSIGVWANSLNLARLMSNVRRWWHVRALFAELSCSYLQDARPQTVLVENPKTLDEKGKLVSLFSHSDHNSFSISAKSASELWTINLTRLFCFSWSWSRWAMSPLVSPHGKDDQELLRGIIPRIYW